MSNISMLGLDKVMSAAEHIVFHIKKARPYGITFNEVNELLEDLEIGVNDIQAGIKSITAFNKEFGEK